MMPSILSFASPNGPVASLAESRQPRRLWRNFASSSLRRNAVVGRFEDAACSRSRGATILRAQAGSSGEENRLAPVEPRTPFGEMLTYYLKMEPQLFKSAVEDQLDRLKEEVEAQKAKEEAAKNMQDDKTDQSELILYQRMEEMRRRELKATLEDLMYISVLEKFVELNIDMMPRIDDDVQPSTDLSALTEGVHSKEAVELVKEHVLAVMGPAAMAFSQAQVKLSKLQMAQVYAASVMFGYFLRRVDKRFKLAQSFGMLPDDKEDAAQTLEKLFNEAASAASVDDLDTPSTSSSSSEDSTSTSSSSNPGQQKSALRKYVESFDEETMKEMARMVSKEGSDLVERQTVGLFGDIKKLQQEMQEAVGTDVMSVEDLLQKVESAVESGAVETLVITVGTQRRAVLEAVAFGTFLRDVETWVENDYGLLTALPPPDFTMGPGGPGGPMV